MAKKKKSSIINWLLRKIGYIQKPELCGNCRFFYWPDKTQKVTVSKCRKYSPTPEMDSLKDVDISIPTIWWPDINHTFWCGDYKKERRSLIHILKNIVTFWT